MNTESIRILYDYSAWANRRILDTTARLTPEQFLAEGGASYGSVRDTLVHTLSAQEVWLSRWKSAAPPTALNAVDFPDLDAIRGRWERIEHDTSDFLTMLRDADRIVEYVNSKGERWAYPLWQQMLHQVNHATQHRSEVAVLLTQFGHSPGELDLLIYIDQQNA